MLCYMKMFVQWAISKKNDESSIDNHVEYRLYWTDINQNSPRFIQQILYRFSLPNCIEIKMALETIYADW
jgi:hypothetical protein